MLIHNIATYKELSNHYRKRQKQIWKNISTSKKRIYWVNQAVGMHIEADDVIQWWGPSKNVHKLVGLKNKVILSNHQFNYLDIGFGSNRGKNFGTAISWRDMYKFDPRVKDVNVIGGQACLWGEMSNAQDQDQKLWMRTSVLNERLWNPKIDGEK